MQTIETMADIEYGIAELITREQRFAKLVEATGLPPLRRAEGGFRGLMLIVTEQQLSTASAMAIWARMEDQLAPMTPDHLATLNDATLRAAGCSRPKVKTIRALCDAFLSGDCDPDHLDTLSDEDVYQRLVAIKGIGRWTADIYLLACLGRADAWPVGDLALQVAAQHAFGLDGRPDDKSMLALGEPWRPWRAVAARVLWSYYRVAKRSAG
jgi:DNA-3-methyladenine glycosylase II